MYTYLSLYYKVWQFANVLKKHGVRKGDRAPSTCRYSRLVIAIVLACALHRRESTHRVLARGGLVGR